VNKRLESFVIGMISAPNGVCDKWNGIFWCSQTQCLNRYTVIHRFGVVMFFSGFSSALRAAALFAVTAACFVAAPAHAADDFLEQDKAFAISATAVDDKTVEVKFNIAEGYYMYRERFKFEAAPAAVKVGTIDLPKGKIKFDETFNKDVEYYRHSFVVKVPVQADAAHKGPIKLTVTNQGCADKGLCYPPQDSVVQVELLGAGGAKNATKVLNEAEATALFPTTNTSTSTSSVAGNISGSSGVSGASIAGNTAPAQASVDNLVTTKSKMDDDPNKLQKILNEGNPLWIVVFFLGAGLLLSFTPCVLPMIPILSSIIVGEGSQVSRSKGFMMALSYSLGMALFYTGVGIAAGLLGEGLGAALQKPWVLLLFATLLVGLSLSMFGFYDLQMPNFIQSKLNDVSGKLQGGKLIGVFVMGAISALIVGPCVAAPLASVLVFISQTKNAVTGGLALFSLAAGMSVPLLLVGLSAGSLLPRAGGWMEKVKYVFGVLIIATAIWMVSPAIPLWLEMLLWAGLLVISATYMRVFDPLPDAAPGMSRFFKGLGIVLALIGASLVFGAASGSKDLLRPLGHLGGGGAGHAAGAAAHPTFSKVRNVQELESRLAAAGKPVMLDFYADWCVACKEMERFTFSDPQVQARMNNMLLLQADVTNNSAEDKALLKKFNLFGPPGMIFFDAKGKESGRVVGYEPADKFLNSLKAVAQ
jgi:thioredoxin:protein disulfide reductase